MTWVESTINVSSASAIMFVSYGALKQLNTMTNVDKCALTNLNIGLVSGIVYGGLVLYTSIYQK